MFGEHTQTNSPRTDAVLLRQVGVFVLPLHCDHEDSISFKWGGEHSKQNLGETIHSGPQYKQGNSGSGVWTSVVNIQCCLNKDRMRQAAWVYFEPGHWVHKQLSPTHTQTHKRHPVVCWVVFPGKKKKKKPRIMQLRQVVASATVASAASVVLLCVHQSV